MAVRPGRRPSNAPHEAKRLGCSGAETKEDTSAVVHSPSTHSAHAKGDGQLKLFSLTLRGASFPYRPGTCLFSQIE